MRKHTPGVWLPSTLQLNKEYWAMLHADTVHTVRRGEQVIAAVWGLSNVDAQANARLIAAAPDLLSAIKPLVRQLETARKGSQDDVGCALAAIAKAEGRE